MTATQVRREPLDRCDETTSDFAVVITGPRTTAVTLTDWRAGVSRSHQYISTSLHAEGKVGGALYVSLWVEVMLQRNNEPLVCLYRRPNDDSWQRESFPAAADKMLTRLVSVALQQHGGFDAVWTSTFRQSQASGASGPSTQLVELLERAAALQANSAVADMLAAGRLAVVAYRPAFSDPEVRVRDYRCEYGSIGVSQRLGPT
jgi:hypothetical protein